MTFEGGQRIHGSMYHTEREELYVRYIPDSLVLFNTKRQEREWERGGGRPLRPIAPKRPRKALESFFVCRPRGCTDLYDASVCGVKAQTVAGSSLYIFLLPFLSCKDGADYSSGSFVELKLQSKLKGYSQTFIIGPCSRPFCLF